MTKSEGNRSGKAALEFDIGDIPMLREALSLGGATALCYGREGDGSRKRFKELLAEIDRISPIPGGHRSEAYHWRDACARMPTASFYAVRVVSPEMRHQEKEFRDLHLVVDGRIHRVAHEVRIGNVNAVVTRMSEALHEVAGIDTVLRTEVAYEMALSGADWAWEDKERNEAVLKTLNELVDGGVDGVLTVLGSKSKFKRTEDGRELVEARIEAASHVHERLAEVCALTVAPAHSRKP